jgi:hypothetical protein
MKGALPQARSLMAKSVAGCRLLAPLSRWRWFVAGGRGGFAVRVIPVGTLR